MSRVRASSKQPQQALMNAIAADDVPRIVELIKNKRGVNGISSGTGHTPLTFAVERGNAAVVAAIVDALIRNEIDMRVSGSQTLQVCARAQFASARRCAKQQRALALAQVAEVNSRDAFGFTALHHAVRGSNDDVLRALVECPVSENRKERAHKKTSPDQQQRGDGAQGIDVESADNDQNTPYHFFFEKNCSPNWHKFAKAKSEQPKRAAQTRPRR